MENTQSSPRLLIFGGNGYVGTKILELAVLGGAHCTCVSRTGAIPAHLIKTKAAWVDQVVWLAGDASQPDPALFATADVVISLVGSAPVPTFSDSAFQQQLLQNGGASSAVINMAKRQGVKRFVLMSAHIPALMQSQRFGYYVGKQQALAAAKTFSEASTEHTITVIRPSAIYGTRHTDNGAAIPLTPLMAPIAWMMRAFPKKLLAVLPESPVCLSKVASTVVDIALSPACEPGFALIENEQLLAR